MTSSLKEHIRSVLLNVNSVLKLTDFSYTEQQFENVGQNYFGVLVPVTVTGEDEGKKVCLSLVLKLAPTDDRYRVSGAVTFMFAREIFVYETLLQKYHTFLIELSLDTQYVIPKCYYVSKEYCKEVIVMQNMCADGFKIYLNHGHVELDYDHMKISLETLAIFHSLSFILKERDERLYNEASNQCLPLMEKYNKRFMEVLQDRLEKAIKIFENTEYISTLLSEFKMNCVKHVEAATLSVRKLCICHGDIWKENILYKYENNKPVSACLIDYQAARICGPALDILYFITISADSNLRREHYKNFLDIYYDQFSKVLRNAGLDSDVIYSRKMFDDDLKTVAPACLILANTTLWLSNGLQEEGHVRSKKNLVSPYEKAKAVSKYKTIIQNVIEDYITYGYFSSKM